MTGDDEHRRLRELLGSYALGHLSGSAAAPVRAHLDGCPACRAELAEIAPLRAELAGVDAARLVRTTAPPADLGERIRSAVAAERELVQRRAGRTAGRSRLRDGRLLRVAAAVVLVAAALGGGVLLGRAGAPSAPVAAPVPVEALRLVPVGGAELAVTEAGVVPHTWGVEVRMVGSGFPAAGVFRAAFRTRDGATVPAGEFLGTGEDPVRCNLQAALLRPDAVGFVITDEAGTPVLSADLPRRS